MTVAERLAHIRQEIARRTSRPVTIVGVAKKQPVERVREALAAGLSDLANNYEQEGRELMEALGPVPVRWHFVGHIQSRKAKLLVDYDLVQSIERAVIVESWQRALVGDGRCLDALVEVNVGGEAQKSGVRPDQVTEILRDLSRFSAVRVRGLMAMPPPLEPVEARRPFFRQMRELFEQHRKGAHFDTLSMGTSADYLVAIDEGATMVRLGETLFGPR